MSEYTTTPNLGLFKPDYNKDWDSWGDHLNRNADKIDAAVGVTVPPYGSIQAAIDALPATGGRVELSANTTYLLTSGISTSKPNVTLTAPGWGSIIRRDPSFTTGVLVSMTGAGAIIENLTVDGNGVIPTNYGGYSEALVSGANSIVRGCHIMNSKGTIHLTLAGMYSKALFNKITGPGINLHVETGYGIWALNGDTVLIEGNTVTDTCADGIGFGGPGSRAIGNHISNCHLYSENGGGQLAYYDITLGVPAGVGLSQGNYIGATPTGDGLEVSGKYFISDGDEVEGVGGYGMHISATSGHVTLVNGIIRNTGSGSPTFMDGIIIDANVSDIKIHQMQILDDRATKVMRSCIAFNVGTSDNITITNNSFGPFLNFAIVDFGTTGMNKIVKNNLGIDNTFTPIAILSGTISPLWGETQVISNVGTVTSIQGVLYNNRVARFFSGSGTVVYQAGSGNIMNTTTCALNNYKEGMYLNGNWYFQT
jgi:hypothetical protein